MGTSLPCDRSEADGSASTGIIIRQSDPQDPVTECYQPEYTDFTANR